MPFPISLFLESDPSSRQPPHIKFLYFTSPSFLPRQNKSNPHNNTLFSFSFFNGNKMMKDKESSSSSSVVPESVIDSANKTLSNLQQVETQLLQFLSLADPDVLSEMHPLQRAQSLFLLAKATTVLFSLRLRCSGIHPNEHRVKTELDRLSLYEAKLERFVDLNKAPLRPATTLNYQAATRFIEHSLPDLTPEQRKSMRAISKGEAPRIKYLERNIQKKRKYQSSEKQSVQDAAKDFLEKAARELLGDNANGFKEPIIIDSSDEDNPAAE